MPLKYEDEFRCRIDLMKSYCDAAKSYMQIAAAALALPLFFTQILLGKQAMEQGLKHHLPWPLYASWAGFLMCILFGLVYQWLAIRLVWDELYEVNRTISNSREVGFRSTWWIPRLYWLNRSALYGGMVICFFLGVVFFVLFASDRLAS
jgi:hypothetical protein